MGIARQIDASLRFLFFEKVCGFSLKQTDVSRVCSYLPLSHGLAQEEHCFLTTRHVRMIGPLWTGRKGFFTLGTKEEPPVLAGHFIFHPREGIC